MVTHEDAKQMDQVIQMLYKIGITSIHVFAEAGVRISQRYDHAQHQSPEWDCPYKLWRGALLLAGEIYTSLSDLFLIVRPGCTFWYGLPDYCAKTINRDEVVVWSPHTPTRVFPSENIMRPQCDVATPVWCQTPVFADVETHHCFVVTGHVLALMGLYLPAREESAAVGCSLADQLGRRGVQYAFHIPSLVDVHTDNNFSAIDFVGTSYHINEKDIETHNFVALSKNNSKRKLKK